MSLVIYCQHGNDFVGLIKESRYKYGIDYLKIKTADGNIIEIRASHTRTYPGPTPGRFYIGERVTIKNDPFRGGLIIDKTSKRVQIKTDLGYTYVIDIDRIIHLDLEGLEPAFELTELPEDSE